jgi:hypothetical protein
MSTHSGALHRRILARAGVVAAGLAASLFSATFVAEAQAVPSGKGPGTYINVGVEPSLYQIQYGQQRLGGLTVYVDSNPYRRIGAEAEYRRLSFHSTEDVHETTYLLGPKLSLKLRSLRPYGKFLVGRAQFNFPFSYAHGSYFAFASGGGVDWHLRGTPLTVRLIDFEYQRWPGFSYGPLDPYGYSAGLALRVR